MHKFKKGDKARVKSGATGAIANYVGQIVTVCGDPTLALFGVQVPGGGVHPVFASELEPIAETPQLQPGDMAYCTEPGHPCQGTLVAVLGPYTFDPDRIAVTALNGRQYHCDPKHLQPAPQPTQTQPAASATKPCPDCAHTLHPGRYVGFSGFPEPCKTCGGKMTVPAPLTLGAVVANLPDDGSFTVTRYTAKPDDTVCRTWPVDPSDPLKVGDLVAVWVYVYNPKGPRIMGPILDIDKDGDPAVLTQFEEPGANEPVGLTRRWRLKAVLRWNGVAP